jgi:hypothetical protein
MTDKRGRKPFSPDGKATHDIRVRLTESERAMVDQASGGKPTKWLRRVVLEQARSQLQAMAEVAPEAAFWTITELAAELGGHHNCVRKWCHKLGLGTMAGSAYILTAEEREQLRWVYSLEHHARITLSWGTMHVYYPDLWERRPKGFKLKKEGK